MISFEKIIYTQVCNYILQYLIPLLCGFQQGHDTQHALFQLLKAWRRELDESGYTGTVLMDLSKAHDCLPHDLITVKFEAYGFDNSSLKLFHRYFSNRKQSKKKMISFKRVNRFFNWDTPRFYSLFRIWF